MTTELDTSANQRQRWQDLCELTGWTLITWSHHNAKLDTSAHGDLILTTSEREDILRNIHRARTAMLDIDRLADALAFTSRFVDDNPDTFDDFNLLLEETLSNYGSPVYNDITETNDAP